MKQGVVALVAGLVVAAIVTFAMQRWRAAKDAEHDAYVIDLGKQALGAADLCDASDRSLAATYAMGAKYLPIYLATDRVHAATLLADTIAPLLDSRETACSTALTLVQMYQREFGEPYPEAAAAEQRTQQHMDRLTRAHAALDALHAALVKPQPPDDIRGLVERLEAAMRN